MFKESNIRIYHSNVRRKRNKKGRRSFSFSLVYYWLLAIMYSQKNKACSLSRRSTPSISGADVDALAIFSFLKKQRQGLEVLAVYLKRKGSGSSFEYSDNVYMLCI